MSKPSRRANHEVIKQKRKERAAKQLLQTQWAKGLTPAVSPSISNAKRRQRGRVFIPDTRPLCLPHQVLEENQFPVQPDLLVKTKVRAIFRNQRRQKIGSDR